MTVTEGINVVYAINTVDVDVAAAVGFINAVEVFVVEFVHAAYTVHINAAVISYLAVVAFIFVDFRFVKEEFKATSETDQC